MRVLLLVSALFLAGCLPPPRHYSAPPVYSTATTYIAPQSGMPPLIPDGAGAYNGTLMSACKEHWWETKNGRKSPFEGHPISAEGVVIDPTIPQFKTADNVFVYAQTERFYDLKKGQRVRATGRVQTITYLSDSACNLYLRNSVFH